MLDTHKEMYLAKLDEIAESAISDHGKGEHIISLTNHIALESSWDYAEFIELTIKHPIVIRLSDAKEDASTDYFREWLPQVARLAMLIKKLGNASSATRLELAKEIMKFTHTQNMDGADGSLLCCRRLCVSGSATTLAQEISM